jgi:protein-disulfide isomerase
VTRFWVAGAALIAILQGEGAMAADFTAQQRAEIVRIVREALKKDPSILREAVEALQSNESERQAVAARETISANHDALYSQADPAGGGAKPDVTIVEFLDPRCPYCRHLAPAMASLLEHDTGIRVIYKDMPILGPPSVLASRALLAADRQGRYELLLTAVMTGSPDITEDSLRAHAERLGLDWPRLQRDMADPAIEARLDGNRRLAKVLGIEGTPAFVVGDRLVVGSDLTEVQGAIAALRADRKQSGTASRKQ